MKKLPTPFCLMIVLLYACTPPKKNTIKDETNAKIEPAYFGNEAKKIDIDYIVGKWHITSIQFSEDGVNSKNESAWAPMSTSYIKRSNWISIEFTSDRKFLLDHDTVGVWFEKNHDLVLSGRVKNLSIPFFLNTSYMVGKGRFVGFLTCTFNKGNKPHHKVRYTILKDKADNKSYPRKLGSNPDLNNPSKH